MKTQKTIQLKRFEFENGDIQDVEVLFTYYGKFDLSKDVIFTFHNFSASSDICDWWPELFGEGKTYDPRIHFIVCVNTLGSPYGSSAPTNLDFPYFSVRDLAKTQIEVANYLGIDVIHTLLGASFGGSQALEFALLYKGKIEHMVLMACAAKESPWAIGLHESQRLALKADPTFSQPGGGQAGLKAARAAAVLNYRTSQSIVKRQADDEEKLDDFRASSYVAYQGEKFVKRFTALSYYFLSKCLDTHNIYRGREVDCLCSLDFPVLVLAMKNDGLVPKEDTLALKKALPYGIFSIIDTTFGHDGFLIEHEKVSQEISAFYIMSKYILEEVECR